MTIVTSRRKLIAGLGSGLVLAGCDSWSRNESVRRVLASAEGLTMGAQRAIGGDALAREYSEAEMSPVFRANGSRTADTAEYRAMLANGFADYRLRIDGLVARPLSLSLEALRRLPARTQITRHDCVEGWSAIGGWTGVPLSVLLDTAGLAADARYIVFWCADVFRGWQYYESIDLIDAYHPQTILAYDMNGARLPTGHGAPLRLRVERQLGYKHAKFVMRVQAVTSMEDIGEGKGGFWEDASGYEWFAGI